MTVGHVHCYVEEDGEMFSVLVVRFLVILLPLGAAAKSSFLVMLKIEKNSTWFSYPLQRM